MAVKSIRSLESLTVLVISVCLKGVNKLSKYLFDLKKEQIILTSFSMFLVDCVTGCFLSVTLAS